MSSLTWARVPLPAPTVNCPPTRNVDALPLDPLPHLRGEASDPFGIRAVTGGSTVQGCAVDPTAHPCTVAAPPVLDVLDLDEVTPTANAAAGQMFLDDPCLFPTEDPAP